MKDKLKTEDIDVVILCGGKGKRLRPIVDDRPKVLAKIEGRAFLDILLNYVSDFGFKRFILCIGYLGQMIKDYFQKRDISFKILFSEEKEPLDTAGAIKNAESLIKTDTFLAMNGDALCKLDFNKFLDFHISKKASASIVLITVKDTTGYGLVKMDNLGQIISFNEKQKQIGPGLINAGIYLLERDILSMIPAGKSFSLEYDLFPGLIKHRFFGYEINSSFIDIGTPERYKEAKLILESLYK